MFLLGENAFFFVLVTKKNQRTNTEKKIIISSVRRVDKTMRAFLSCLLTADKNNRFIVLKNWRKDLDSIRWRLYWLIR